jgi:plasmid stability protein
MYDVMHRTQVNLEEWQYESLKIWAERQSRSLSDLVREAVSEYLADEEEPTGGVLAALAGVGDDPEAAGRDHDRFLYSDSR